MQTLDLVDVSDTLLSYVEPMVSPVAVKEHPGSIREYAEERMHESGKIVLMNIFDGEMSGVTEAQPFPTLYPVLTILAKHIESNFEGNPILKIISDIVNGIDASSKITASGTLFVVRVEAFSYVTRYSKVDVLRYGVGLSLRPK
jgi:hypothetical protein